MNDQVPALDAEQLRKLRKLGRLSMLLLIGGGSVIVGTFVAGIWQGENLERQAATDRELARQRENEAKHARTHAEALAAFVEGRSPSVFTDGAPSIAEKLHPTAHFSRDASAARFTLSVDPDPSIVAEIKSVRYQLDPKLYANNIYQGTPPGFSVDAVVSNCRSTVSADIQLTDGQSAKVSFDWCKLSGWGEYDASRVLGVAALPPSCSVTRAILFEVPKDVVGKIGPVQILKQVYRADLRWQPTNVSMPVTFVEQHRLGDDANLAVVAKCTHPNTCTSLASAFYAAARGTPPQVVCGDIPGFDKQEMTVPQLRDGIPPAEFEPRSAWEKCFRVSACEVARFGAATQYPISACLVSDSSPPPALTECGIQLDCDSVLACASSRAP